MTNLQFCSVRNCKATLNLLLYFFCSTHMICVGGECKVKIVIDTMTANACGWESDAYFKLKYVYHRIITNALQLSCWTDHRCKEERLFGITAVDDDFIVQLIFCGVIFRPYLTQPLQVAWNLTKSEFGSCRRATLTISYFLSQKTNTCERCVSLLLSPPRWPCG